MTNPLSKWALVLNDNDDLNLEKNWEKISSQLIDVLKKTKKYVFQLEQGNETNRLHFQGRFTLGDKNKKRKTDCLKLFPEALSTISLRPEVNTLKSEFYCIKKDETYRQGPIS